MVQVQAAYSACLVKFQLKLLKFSRINIKIIRVRFIRLQLINKCTIENFFITLINKKLLII